MPAKKPRTSKHVRVDEPPYDYDAPGAMARQQRVERLEGLVQVFADIFAGLSSEQRARYMTTEQEAN